MKTDPQVSQTVELAEAGATRSAIDANWEELGEHTAPAGADGANGGSTPISTPPPATTEPGSAQPGAISTSPTAESIETATNSARVAGFLVPGSKFGVYVVGECIGEGGMARIYRAEHEGLRRQVALKVLTGSFARDPDGWERFVREGRIAAAVKHPNVVNIFDVGVQDGVPFLVMELLEGTDLESLVEQKGPLDEALILDIMVPVVAGLAAVHDAGIVHRDLKPGNIFLAKGRYEDIEPKLLDFGISKATGLDQLKLTTQGFLIGTPFYLAPEGYRGEEMTPRSDQYSLGVVMYECATGDGPFGASTLPELVRAVTTGQIQPMSRRNPNVSARLQGIVERCIRLDPTERYADLRELGRDLLKLAGQRTRITWGLSFGEPTTNDAALEATPEPARPQSLVPLTASVPPPPIPFTQRSARAWPLAAFGITLFALVLLVARQVLGPDTVTPPAAHAIAELTPSTAGDTLVRAKAEAEMPHPEATASPEPMSTALARGKSGSGRTTSRLVRSRSAPAAARGLPMGDAPDWVLPVASSQASALVPRGATPFGTNGAPILD